MAKSAAHRLRIELKRFNDEPTPLFLAKPIESNIMEWRFAMKGAPETPYAGGIYHGKLVFPQDYPWKPPSIIMLTPSGRFKTNTRICLSISDFHPETWCPSWTVNTILTGIISFFNSDESTVGSIEESLERRRELSLSSHDFNKKDKVFQELFGPDPHAMFEEFESRKPPGKSSAKATAGGAAADAKLGTTASDPGAMTSTTTADTSAKETEKETEKVMGSSLLTTVLSAMGIGGETAPKFEP